MSKNNLRRVEASGMIMLFMFTMALFFPCNYQEPNIDKYCLKESAHKVCGAQLYDRMSTNVYVENAKIILTLTRDSSAKEISPKADSSKNESNASKDKRKSRISNPKPNEASANSKNQSSKSKTNSVNQKSNKKNTKHYTDRDAIDIAKVLYGECRGVKSTTEQACVAWTILNRVDQYGSTIHKVVRAKSQFAFHENARVDKALLDLAYDVLDRWNREKNGEKNVGRVLPKQYLYFEGKNGHNYFRAKFKGSNKTWNYSLKSPYKT